LTPLQHVGMMSNMKRTQVQLDDRTYAALRRRAYERGCSISALVRELLAQSLRSPAPVGRRLSLADFPFIGAGRSSQEGRAPVSERHDEALAEALTKKARR
jgi:plasmid stability protein